MVCTTGSGLRFPKNKSASPSYKYAILFPEGKGYLFIQQLPAGRCASPQLVYSLHNSKTCVRKLTKNENSDGNGFPNEVTIGRSLEGSGFVPRILEHKMVHEDQSIIIFDYCDGGDFDNYVKNKICREEDAELLIWHVIAQVIRITTYLQTGWVEGITDTFKQDLATGDQQEGRLIAKKKSERNPTMEISTRRRDETIVDSPERNKRMEADKKQSYDELIVLQPGWKAIFHGDLHPGNIFLDFARPRADNPASQPMLPHVLLGDFGHACYHAPDALDLANLLEELYKLIKYGAVYKCSAAGREALLRTLSPYFMDRLVPPIAEAFQALVPIAEEKVRSYKAVSLPRPECPKAPMLFETPAPLAPGRWIVDSLQEQRPWKWVKIAEENVVRHCFTVFEEVSEVELEKAESHRQFLIQGGRPEILKRR